MRLEQVTHWLDDPLLSRARVFPCPLQLFQVLWQDVGLWEEPKLLLAEADLHLGQIAPQSVLAAQLKGTRKVIKLKKIQAVCLFIEGL